MTMLINDDDDDDDVDKSRMAADREFQVAGPQTEKLRDDP